MSRDVLELGVRDLGLWLSDITWSLLTLRPPCSRIQEEREERHKLKEQMKEASSSGRVSRFEAPELPPITPSPLSLGTWWAVFVRSLLGTSVYISVLI